MDVYVTWRWGAMAVNGTMVDVKRLECVIARKRLEIIMRLRTVEKRR
jgi:hypothetical protein